MTIELGQEFEKELKWKYWAQITFNFKNKLQAILEIALVLKWVSVLFAYKFRNLGVFWICCRHCYLLQSQKP